MTKKKISVLLLFLLACLCVHFPLVQAQQTTEGYARSVIDALLDWNLTLASERIEAWRECGCADSATLMLYRAAVEVARADFFAGDDPGPYDKPLSALEQAIASAEAILERKPEDFHASLVAATGRAIAARLLMEQGHWLKSYRYGKASRNAMLDLQAQHPEFIDGLLILGLFDYFTSEVPLGIRWLTFLLDFSGDRERGIGQLERVVEAAPVAAPQAADALLLEIDYADGEACRYLSLADLMVKRYPGNPRYPAALRQLRLQCDRAPIEGRAVPHPFILATPLR